MSRFDQGLLSRALAAVGLGSASAEPEALPEPVSIKAKAIEIAAVLCVRFEGYYSHPYLCPAGVPTIGYGATHYLDGRRVKMTDPPISKEAAYRLLLLMIERTYLPGVLKVCPRLINESAEMLAAIIDWTFNLGAGNLRASTMAKRINAGAWEAVPAEIMKWDMAGGRKLRGLTLRRQADADTFIRGLKHESEAR